MCRWHVDDVHMMYVIHTSSLVLVIYSIFYHVQLSFCTLSTQTHIVHVICMWSTHVHIIYLSSLTLLVYPIIHNLVSAHCLHTHTHIVHVICMLSTHVHVICLSSLTLLVYPIIHNLVSVHIVSTHAHCQYHVYICLQMHMLCTSHFYCCYFHMCMSSAYYLGICILCTHYLQWSLSIFLPNRQCRCHPYVISVLFLYPIMYNLVSAHCLHKCTLSMSFACCPRITHHLLVIFTTPHIPYYPQLSFRTLSTHMHIVDVICILFRNACVMYMSSLLLLSVYVHVIYILSGHICIMCRLSEVVLDLFLPNRQYQCDPIHHL